MSAVAVTAAVYVPVTQTSVYIIGQRADRYIVVFRITISYHIYTVTQQSAQVLWRGIVLMSFLSVRGMQIAEAWSGLCGE